MFISLRIPQWTKSSANCPPCCLKNYFIVEVCIGNTLTSFSNGPVYQCRQSRSYSKRPGLNRKKRAVIGNSSLKFQQCSCCKYLTDDSLIIAVCFSVCCFWQSFLKSFFFSSGYFSLHILMEIDLTMSFPSANIPKQ